MFADHTRSIITLGVVSPIFKYKFSLISSVPGLICTIPLFPVAVIAFPAETRFETPTPTAVLVLELQTAYTLWLTWLSTSKEIESPTFNIPIYSSSQKTSTFMMAAAKRLNRVTVIVLSQAGESVDTGTTVPCELPKLLPQAEQNNALSSTLVPQNLQNILLLLVFLRFAGR